MNELFHAIWIFPLAITLHNMEEGLWMPKWSEKHPRFSKIKGKNEFHFALICVTILAYMATFLFALFQSEVIFRYLFYGFVGAMLLNAIMPHLLVTIITKKYCPGVLTGVFLNIPCFSLLIIHSVNEKLINGIEVMISTGIMSIVLLGLLPILFKIGRGVVDVEV
ncbi:HXXEE domain-containing protein [Vallitalea pronyensis]|uniref:HXXEE domain-containing protein n=1 Tax=Vallitalea pronyensis TaxID=1348613 RepID=A0A8J8MHM7_9FIRM|nr:HXXEE domain-containing protein [Vallitalea pronyensis]QUI21413.1 HXXEE domain-containing protein [Vallitalea pronyensis]